MITNQATTQDNAVLLKFQSVVRATPNTLCVIAKNASLTFAQVDEFSTSLAQHLQRALLPGSRVAIWFGRSDPQLVPAIVGILKAGMSFVPMECTFPLKRLEWILDTVGAAAVLSDRSHETDRLNALARGWASVDIPPYQLLVRSEGEKPQGVASSDEVYCLFTSGTLGQAKALRQTSRNVSHFAQVYSTVLRLRCDDCLGFASSLSYDGGIVDFFAAITSGAALLLLDLRSASMGDTKEAVRSRATVWHSTPSVFRVAAENGMLSNASRLRAVVLGGEPVRVDDIQTHVRVAAATELWAVYGQAEYSIAAMYRLASSDDRRPHLDSVVEGTHLLLTRPTGGLADIYETGEIGVVGEFSCRGYLDGGSESAAKFTEAADGSGRPMYQSGDLARVLPGERIELLGRADDQIKIRGFRVNPLEVEQVASQHPELHRIAVISYDTSEGDGRLCAYVASDQGDEVFIRQELLGFLSARLPDYMVPKDVVVVRSLPLTANGKLNRKVLPKPGAEMVGSPNNHVAPRSPEEHALSELWKEILTVQTVGVEDNFFEIGGDSIHVLRLAGAIERRLGKEMDIAGFVRRPFIRDLATSLGEANSVNSPRYVRALTGRDGNSTSAQRRLYAISQMNGLSTAYNLIGAFRLRGRLEVERLEEAFKGLMDRHVSLRTSFELEEGRLLQRIATEEEARSRFRLERGGGGGGGGEEEVKRMISEFVRPFDLSHGPLLRAQVRERGWYEGMEEHWLLVDLHHIVVDGESLPILVEELAALYGGEALGPVRIQYPDYAAWEQEQLGKGGLAAAEAYWLEQLGGELPVLELPTDRTRPKQQEFAGATVEFELEEELAERLRAVARSSGTTPFVLLLAIYQVLLAKYSGQEDIIVGTPVAGRDHADLARVVGMLVNTLALRGRPNAGKTFSSFLSEVTEIVAKALQNRRYPFEQLVEKVAKRNDPSHNPLFDVAFVWQSRLVNSQLRLSELEVIPCRFEGDTSKFDLTVTAWETTAGRGSISCSAQYRTALFEAATIERLIGHFQNVARQVAQDPKQRISQLRLLSEAERHEILEGFNATAADYPSERLIHQLFEEQAARNPEACAVVYEEERMSYGELNRRANRVAHRLIELGVKPDDRVAICMERSAEMVVGILGILKAGGGYVPLDTSYPGERLAYMLKDSGPVAVVTQRQLRESLPKIDIPVVLLDGDRKACAIADVPEHDPCVPAMTSRHLAYVIYTSGSTGAPNGVMVEHRSVLRLVINNSYAQISRKDCVAHCANPTFDASTWEIWAALLNGAKLLVVPQRVALDPESLNSTLIDRGVTALWLTVGLFNEYVDTVHPAFGQLKYLLIGGDALDPRKVESLLRNGHPPLHLINGYGPTESTTFATTFEIQVLDREVGTIPIGRPIANTQVYILDSHFQPAPLGVTGQLYIGGAGVARGYLNRPELTAERFVANIFSSESGARLFKTGDLGRWLPDGNIEFLGRNDFQVKIRGYRVELGEIQARLRECDGVREAAVIAREDTPGNKRLVAYVVAQENEELSPVLLRDHLSRALPPFMVPSAFVNLSKFPLTPVGKLDRSALPLPTESDLPATGSHTLPRTELECKLVTIWRETLQLARVGIDDDFFDLGGNSLKWLDLASRIKQEFNVKIALPDLAAFGCVREQSRLVMTAQTGEYLNLRPIDLRLSSIYTASSAQRRLFVLEQLDHGNVAYHITGVFRLRGRLEVERLEEAFKGLMDRHVSLRTSFELEEGRLLQRIATEEEARSRFRLERGGGGGGGGEEEVKRMISEFVRPFDLSHGPLLRAQVRERGWYEGMEEHWLLVDLHHIVVDGESLPILVEELAALYGGEALGPVRIQYPDYAAWEQEQLGKGGLAAAEAYWLEQLGGELPVLELPTDRTRPKQQEFAGATVEFELEEELAERLRAVARSSGTTPFVLLLAIYQVLLAKYSGQEDIIVGTPVAGRDHADLARVVGMLVNTLALRGRPKEGKRFSAYLNEMAGVLIHGLEHQAYPFEQLVEKVAKRNDPSHNPLFDVAFVWQSRLVNSQLRLSELEVIPCRFEGDTSKFDLTVTAWETTAGRGSISCSAQYRTALFEAATIERLIGHFQNIARQVAQDPKQRISQLRLLSEAERHEILEGFNATAADYPSERLIHQLFEEQAARNPEACAVVYEEERMSYGELNRRANRLAHRLIELGIKPDDRVALCLERSVEMVVGILGILKAGGGYVPLDPSYPEERLAYMVKDSGPVAVVTQAAVQGRLPALAVPVVLLDGEEDLSLLAQQSEDNPDCSRLGLSSGHLAYVIYTSGSTGTPKGVMVEHRNLSRLFAATDNWFGFNENDVWSMFHSVAFDFSVWELWGALGYGGRLVVVPGVVARSPQDFYELVCEEGVTVLNQTPGAFRQLIEAEGQSERRHSLRCVIFGGEALEVRMLRRWVEGNSLEGTRLVNMYGITEITVHGTYHEITAKEVEEGGGRGSVIGKAIADLRIYVLDGHLEPVPVGVAGELYVGGAGVARGYLNRPELTAERFIADRFRPESGGSGRLYKTGDLGRWRGDGTIEYLGRNDFQVKIRGYRVELGEIEAALLEHGEVAASAVVAHAINDGEKSLCAYVVVSNEEKGFLNRQELKTYLAQKLPQYMVPSQFVYLSKLPLTPVGKLDRSALPLPTENDLPASGSHTPPRTDLERKLVAIWKEVLQLDRVGIDDNFFDLGGSSLKLVELHRRLVALSTNEFRLVTVFRHPTVRSQTELLVAPAKDIALSPNPVVELDKIPSLRGSLRQRRIARCSPSPEG